MNEQQQTLNELSEDFKTHFQEQRVILTFSEYIELLSKRPTAMVRDSATYLRDTFRHFGEDSVGEASKQISSFALFGIGSEKSGPIIGCESVQNDIYQSIDAFVRQGYSNRLILLHGPNGSAKTSTIEAIFHAMKLYSQTDDGAVYSFNWIFPTEKTSNPSMGGQNGPIGFSGKYDEESSDQSSYALVDESKISCKIPSEFRDNPLFILPMPQREALLRKWLAKEQGISPEEVEVPVRLLSPGLSKKNQLIFENMISAYNGDLSKVLRHIQVERFFYSHQYRVGQATVEPQMSIDAVERQLTMDKNVQNLPVFLQNIRFNEVSGPLVEANRGVMEFSDMLKRPLEAYKYLLTTIEKGTISLPTSTANLDCVFFGTTNEKHLDAFKSAPDFSSFRSRFDLVTVPYLLRPSKEVKIYEQDRKSLSKIKKICPHAIESLCLWSVLTRLKQPDPEYYDSKYRALLARLSPRSKVALYEGESLQPEFKPAEEAILRELRSVIYEESRGITIYEGRFGASPREVRGILSRALQNPSYKTLTPMVIFSELKRLVKDRTVYEFLQFESRGGYHDAQKFISVIEKDFCDRFEYELLSSMSLVSDSQYDSHLRNYIDHVVAFVKGEKIYYEATRSYDAPSEDIMKEFEKIIDVTGSVDLHRQNILGRVAAYKIDNPKDAIDVKNIFVDLMKKVQKHYHDEKKKIVDSNFESMIKLKNPSESKNLSSEQIKQAEITYQQLEERFGYDEISAKECLKFLLNRKNVSQAG